MTFVVWVLTTVSVKIGFVPTPNDLNRKTKGFPHTPCQQARITFGLFNFTICSMSSWQSLSGGGNGSLGFSGSLGVGEKVNASRTITV